MRDLATGADRRAPLDRTMGGGGSERGADRGPAVGKRALTESNAASADTALAAVAFFDRAVGELRAQLAALAGAIVSGDRLIAVAASRDREPQRGGDAGRSWQLGGDHGAAQRRSARRQGPRSAAAGAEAG